MLLSSQNTKHATFIVSHNNVDMYTQCYSEHCSKTSSERTMKGKRDNMNVEKYEEKVLFGCCILYHYIKLGHVINENDKAFSIFFSWCGVWCAIEHFYPLCVSIRYYYFFIILFLLLSPFLCAF